MIDLEEITNNNVNADSFTNHKGEPKTWHNEGCFLLYLRKTGGFLTVTVSGTQYCVTYVWIKVCLLLTLFLKLLALIWALLNVLPPVPDRPTKPSSGKLLGKKTKKKS